MNLELARLKLGHLGLIRTLQYYAGRALTRMTGVETYWLMCLEPDGIPPQPSLSIAPVDADRLRREAADRASGLDPANVAEALANGDTCLGAFLEGTLASHLLLAEKSRAHLSGDVHVQLDGHWGYSRWAFTREQFRGFGLHQVLKTSALAAQVAAGRRGILSLVSALNFESLNAAENLGCRRVGWVAVARLAGRSVALRSASCAAYGLSVHVSPPKAP